MMWRTTRGHSKQIEQLQRAIREGKLHHAYLFAGIEGIGKKRVAIGLAEALNPHSAAKIKNKNHPDTYFIEPEKTRIKIEAIRALKQKIYLHPLEGEVKVVILDGAEAMTEAASNALLKILEEPPADTYFILISSKPSYLLPTIRSRCQKIEFYPLSQETILDALKKEGMPLQETSLRARFSGGSLAAAVHFDAKLFEKIHTEIRTLGQNPKPSAILNLAEQWLEEEENLPFILKTLSYLWHQRILATEENNPLTQQTEQWEAIQKAGQALEAYANKQLLVENLLFTLSSR